MTDLKIKLLPNFKGNKNELKPRTEGASGIDIPLSSEGTVECVPGKPLLLSTGIAVEIPLGYEGQIRSRSGLAAETSVVVLNGIGTIDSDYRGEIKVLLNNFGTRTIALVPGMRIAQLVVSRVETPHLDIEFVEELSNTRRGERGFGSTGLAKTREDY